MAKKTWLKYGLILFLISIVISILFIVLKNFDLLLIVNILGYYLSEILDISLGGDPHNLYYQIYLTILSSVIYFIIGAIIGFVIDKMRRKK